MLAKLNKLWIRLIFQTDVNTQKYLVKIQIKKQNNNAPTEIISSNFELSSSSFVTSTSFPPFYLSPFRVIPPPHPFCRQKNHSLCTLLTLKIVSSRHLLLQFVTKVPQKILNNSFFLLYNLKHPIIVNSSVIIF